LVVLGVAVAGGEKRTAKGGWIEGKYEVQAKLEGEKTASF
jgi:hypothetical protein